VLLARARALRAEGDLAGARGRLEAALAAAPASDQVRLELADLLVADGREADRAAALLDGVAAREGNAPFCRVSAHLAELRGDGAAAADAYGRALALEDDPELRLRRALVLEELGRGPEALSELERVRLARPDDALVRARLAVRYEAAGRTSEAEAELMRLADAAPERAAPWRELAAFYRRVGRAEAARPAEARADQAAGPRERKLRPLPPSRR
jgi:predicted Zn-dependent protease